MTPKTVSARGPAALRRNAVWPFLVMPLIILAVFWVLHDVRRDSAPGGQESSFGSGIP